MSDKTGIQYLDATWNPITGCTHAASPGCDHCWAREWHNRWRAAYQKGQTKAEQYAKPFSEIQFWPDRLDQPLHWRKPRDIGVCFGADWMHDGVSVDDIYRIFRVTEMAEQHRFFTLTKRSKRLLKLFATSPALPNVFHGVTVCNQAEMWKAEELLKVPGNLWVSFEPLLFSIDARPLLASGRISLVVIGCESGPNRRLCRLEWILDIVRQCRAASVPCFVKQIPVPMISAGRLREDLELADDPNCNRACSTWDLDCVSNGWRVSHDPAEWPEELRVQEKL